jgi:signal transduction histidine kinase
MGYAMAESARGAPRSPLLGLALAVSWVAAVTLLLYPISELDPGVSSGTLYILGVLLLATYWGVWLGVATSAASALAIDYFHTVPEHSFSVASTGDVVALVVMVLTACVGSVIANRARLRATDAEERLRLEEELRARELERVRLEEVRASRSRVIAAADDERRRVVRDLHDGAQQRLVHTVVTLKLAQRALERGEGDAPEVIAEALDHAQRATNELRELAHGILPSVLTHGGLEAGVDALASRMPVPVELDLTTARFPASVESTAYFVIAEALTNVAKHSDASRAWVMARVDGGLLRMEVRDDGGGGAWRGGSGLLGLQDRLAAVDGALRVESPEGRGTTIVAAIPVPEPAGVGEEAPAATSQPLQVRDSRT